MFKLVFSLLSSIYHSFNLQHCWLEKMSRQSKYDSAVNSEYVTRRLQCLHALLISVYHILTTGRCPREKKRSSPPCIADFAGCTYDSECNTNEKCCRNSKCGYKECKKAVSHRHDQFIGAKTCMTWSDLVWVVCPDKESNFRTSNSRTTGSNIHLFV